MQLPSDIPNGVAAGLITQDEERAQFRAPSLALESAGPGAARGSELATLPEWQLAVRVASSRQLAKSDLLQRFLLGVCQMTLEGRADEITEYRIGTAIFQRPATYNPGEDNIVRSYARMLRRRLDVYFNNEGASEPLRILIPRGGYVPVFERGDAPRATSSEQRICASQPPAAPERFPLGQPDGPSRTADQLDILIAPPLRNKRLTAQQWALLASGLGAGLVLALLLSLLLPDGWHPDERRREPAAAHALWSQIFTTERNTLIVPADAGLGIFQNLTGQEVTLAEYASGTYVSGPTLAAGIDPASLNDLRRQRYTSVADLDFVTRLARLPEYLPSRTKVRFARNVIAEDLKSENVVLLGSTHSNPWVELFDPRVNFRFQYGPSVDQSSIINMHPEPGELPRYANQAADARGRTFGTIVWLPSLDGQGQVLIIQGLNMAATQAAAELLFNPAQIGPLLERAKLPNGAIRPFELLIETSSIGAASPAAQVVATRIYTP